ncbi:MAG TPA: hypothetical protein VGR06_38500 [Actinophytocola sp.]|jgi:hypothetical protein|uniref:SMI1/KNR4 family protein n=1 Tax=Actinophytocola sp. TaxID=1872138 RepID=UPI002DFBFE6D|nr:hypothetical protein [Actinophytocola sp.]
MTSALDQLIALVPPGRPASPRTDWSTVERSLGAGLPEDYKRLVDAYGPGSFDGFLWLVQPMPGSHLDLLARQDTAQSNLRTLAEMGEELPYPPDRLMAWAVSSDGDTCYWLRDPEADPDNWTVVANESRGPSWDQFTGTATEFLLAILSGTFTSEALPEDFPSDEPTFEPA